MQITSYRFGAISIDGSDYTKDLKIVQGKVIQDWWRQKGHLLQQQDITDVIAAKPHTLVVGTGASGMMKVAPGLQQFLAEKGIRMETLPSELATMRFNELIEMEGLDRVALAIHLTC